MGADNDPHNLPNAHWVRNVRFFYNQFTEEANGVNKRLTHFNFTLSLTAVFSYLGIDKIKFQRYQRLIEIAEEAKEKVRIGISNTAEASTEQFSKAVGGGVVKARGGRAPLAS